METTVFFLHRVTRLGRALLQTPDEWAARNTVLADALTDLVNRHASSVTGRGLDVGCQSGELTDALARRTALEWWGVDPVIEVERRSPDGALLMPGWAHQLPFPAGHFDCVTLAN